MANIDIDNAAAIFHASDMHNATSLRERAMNFILQNFDQVSKTGGFDHLARANVDLVLEILKSRT
jgi:hypothetical protein